MAKFIAIARPNQLDENLTVIELWVSATHRRLFHDRELSLQLFPNCYALLDSHHCNRLHLSARNACTRVCRHGILIIFDPDLIAHSTYHADLRVRRVAQAIRPTPNTAATINGAIEPSVSAFVRTTAQTPVETAVAADIIASLRR